LTEILIPHHIAACAKAYGFLDEKEYRDFCIREQFNKRRSEGMKVEKIELELSEEFSSQKYPLTPESIHDIIYRKK